METVHDEGVCRRTLNLAEAPPLTDEQRVRMAALAAMPDDQIDYTDAPYRPDALWRRVKGD